MVAAEARLIGRSLQQGSYVGTVILADSVTAQLFSQSPYMVHMVHTVYVACMFLFQSGSSVITKTVLFRSKSQTDGKLLLCAMLSVLKEVSQSLYLRLS